jgi:hypothetical protein
MNRILRVCAASALLAILLSATAQAQIPNLALGRPIIDGSSSWNGAAPGEAPFNGGQFPGSNVTDGNKSEPTDGVISYWLGREGDTMEYLTLDLQAERNIDEIRLFNTHNRQFNDRMTDEFILYASNQVDAMNQLVDPVPILSGNLSNVAGQANITGNVFNSSNGLPSGFAARYLRFETLTAQPGLINVGLNEIEIYDLSLVNHAAGKPIIDGSGSYPNDVPNGAQFPASRVTDQNPGVYWLGREGMPVEHFTIDLQGLQDIREIRLVNTSNAPFHDRGVRDFRILASDTVDASNQLVDAEEILSSRLPNIAGLGAGSQIMVFSDENGLVPTNARYLRFESLSAYYKRSAEELAALPPGAPLFAGTGLGEIEVYSNEWNPPSTLLREGNIAAGKPVIAGSGAWNGGTPCDPATPYNAGPFPASRVTDESIADANTNRTSYWLGREACPNEHFTIDLEGLYDLDEIVLQNAHNAQFNDRGTGEFVIYGSDAVDDLTNELINPVVVVAGDLTNTSNQTVLTADEFPIDPAVPPVRYLQFQAITILSSPTNSGAGLNEFSAYGTLIPEPSTWALTAVAGCAALALLRRRDRRRG